MATTSEDLMNIARAAADKIEIESEARPFPSFSDIEEQCEAEYDELLEALHEDELFEPVNVQRQQELVDALEASLSPDLRALLEELVDNQARHVWLNQEAAFHVGMAVGLRIAGGRRH